MRLPEGMSMMGCLLALNLPKTMVVFLVKARSRPFFRLMMVLHWSPRMRFETLVPTLDSPLRVSFSSKTAL